MAKKKNLPKRMFKKQEVVSPYHTDRSPTKRMKDMSREHEDVLQNIEFVLVTSWRQDPTIDDATVDRVLSIALAGGEPPEDDLQVADMIHHLGSIRQIREDVSDSIWREGLRVVRDSVRRRSDRRPGERGYLEFIQKYVK